MRYHTSEYKDALIGVRETEHILRTIINNNWVTYNNDNLEMVKPILDANLFKTAMKELDIESKTKIEKGTELDYRHGLKVGNDYEYIYYGRYKVEYRPDTKTYYHICYDRMLNTMIPYEPLDITYPISVKNYIKAIAVKCGLFAHTDVFYDGNFPNQDKLITQDYFAEGNYTYRDILDYLCEVVGGWLWLPDRDLELKYPTETHETFNEDYLNYINVSFEKKYGPVNSVVFARANELDNIEYKDDESIAQNGLCRVKFSDNPLLSDENRSEFLNQVAEKIMGLEFYLNDLESKGITYLELGDLYSFKISDEYVEALKTGLVKSGMRKAQGTNKTKYKCLMINDEQQLGKGIVERIYTDEPEEDNSDYIITNPSENSLKNAEILANKAAGEIVLKANSDGQVVQARLDADADDGSLFEVKADNIKLEGYTTINNGFSVDLEGNMIARSGTFSGNISIASDEGLSTPQNYKVNIYNTTSLLNAKLYPDVLIFSENDNINSNRTLITRNGIYLSTDDYINTSGYLTQVSQSWIRLYNYSSSIPTRNQTIIQFDSIQSPTITQTSLEECKKNFEKFDNALGIIKNTDIYKYNLIHEDDDAKKHIGFIIGDNYKYSKELTSKDNDSVDLYSFVSVCCKAIQEQQEQINSLKEEIKKLKESDK